jgi:hypothetical protein
MFIAISSIEGPRSARSEMYRIVISRVQPNTLRSAGAPVARSAPSYKHLAPLERKPMLWGENKFQGRASNLNLPIANEEFEMTKFLVLN